MTTPLPQAPPLPDDLEALFRRMRLPHARTAAPEVLATARSPPPAPPAEVLRVLVDMAYERRSIAVSSNLHPAGFDELMPKTLATATVDRLLHHAHVCVTSGDSVRLSQAGAGIGVIPLTRSDPRPGGGVRRGAS